MKIQRMWAVVNKNTQRVMHNADRHKLVFGSKFAATISENGVEQDEEVVRVEVRIVKPKRKPAQRGRGKR